ncbi:hypothetical protein M3223_15010 [Paenibacillus pasadenensis]|uniref:hypothetical protein n=1 Tax=Paenibacillus pasadenensis TaxID=217090 RepID=UPI0020417654|nr:hypothetical protein [Paenibacillus pasadenensis]MCM3748659.1 hypothetical protein [Paenibacillus pasadenensis]
MLIYFAIVVGLILFVLLKLQSDSVAMKAVHREQLKVSREILKQLEGIGNQLQPAKSETTDITEKRE